MIGFGEAVARSLVAAGICTPEQATTFAEEFAFMERCNATSDPYGAILRRDLGGSMEWTAHEP